MEIFIQSASQISIQNPLCDDWFENPILYTTAYNRSIEPDFKQFISPIASRRMGKLIKRAMATSLSAVHNANIQQLDAIITGTGLGCIENTEKFLSVMVKEGEEFLQPTFFMQSTHNTISSQVALNLKCNGYNCTYSHRGTSFDSAMIDTYLHLKFGKANTILVGGHDEMTPNYFNMLGKIGYWKKDDISQNALQKADSIGSFSGECSVSFVLEKTKKNTSLCKFHDITMLYKPTQERLKEVIEEMKTEANISTIDTLFLGLNGDMENDKIYINFAKTFFPDATICWYKNIFGESFTASGLGLYAAATCIHKQCIPQHLMYNQNKSIVKPQNVLIYNHFQNKDHSLMLLSQC